MAEYIKREDAEKILFDIMYEGPPYIDSDIAIKTSINQMERAGATAGYVVFGKKQGKYS